MINPQELVGKTIASVVPSEDPTEALGAIYADVWRIDFTDGTAIELRASYDDSSVHISEVKR